MQIPCARGSVFLWRRCDTLCTSGFMDDVTFGRSGPDDDTWILHVAATTLSGVAIPGWSLMSMNALLQALPEPTRCLTTDMAVFCHNPSLCCCNSSHCSRYPYTGRAHLAPSKTRGDQQVYFTLHVLQFSLTGSLLRL